MSFERRLRETALRPAMPASFPPTKFSLFEVPSSCKSVRLMRIIIMAPGAAIIRKSNCPIAGKLGKVLLHGRATREEREEAPGISSAWRSVLHHMAAKDTADVAISSSPVVLQSAAH